MLPFFIASIKVGYFFFPLPLLLASVTLSHPPTQTSPLPPLAFVARTRYAKVPFPVASVYVKKVEKNA